jgi:hypothetical protein
MRWVALTATTVVAAALLILWLSHGWWDPWVDARPVGFAILTSVATAGGALGTAVAAVIAVSQLTHQRKVAIWDSSRDSMWRFSGAWAELSSARERLAVIDVNKGLANLDPAEDHPDAIAILDFFDGLASMANEGHINDRMSWTWFYVDAQSWCASLEPYVRRVQVGDPLAWAEIPEWLRRLDRVEKRELARLQRRKRGNWLQNWRPKPS